MEYITLFFCRGVTIAPVFHELHPCLLKPGSKPNRESCALTLPHLVTALFIVAFNLHFCHFVADRLLHKMFLLFDCVLSPQAAYVSMTLGIRYYVIFLW